MDNNNIIYHNKATKKSNLCFDVMVRKKWLNEYYEQNNMFVNHKKYMNYNDSDNDNNNNNEDFNSLPMCQGGHFGIACVEQVMLDIIINECLKKCKLSKDGTYIIDYNLIVNTILLEPKLNKIISSDILNKYDSKMNYKYLIKIKERNSTNEIIEYVENKNKNTNFMRCAENFISFLFHHNRTHLADICYKLNKYAKKRSISINTVKHAIMIYYPENSDFLNDTIKKLDEVDNFINAVNHDEKKMKYDKNYYKKMKKNFDKKCKKYSDSEDTEEKKPKSKYEGPKYGEKKVDIKYSDSESDTESC
jgi:hypothetical protein